MMILKFWLYTTTVLSVQKYFFFFKLTKNAIIYISVTTLFPIFIINQKKSHGVQYKF